MNVAAKLHSHCPASEGCPAFGVMHHLWHEGEYEKCEEALRASLEECPDCPVNTGQLVTCLEMLNRYEEADAQVEDLFPRANGSFQMSTLCARKADILLHCIGLRAARPWFELAVELDPNESNLSDLAYIMWQRGRKETAADLAERALALKPLDPAVIRQAAAILIEAGRSEVARVHLHTLSEREYEIPHYHLVVALALVAAGDERRGLALARRVAATYRESIRVACGVSQLLLQKGKEGAAAPLLRRLLKLDPARHGKVSLINLALVAAGENNVAQMLRWAVQANVEFNDADTRRVLAKITKLVTSQMREREASLQKLAAEHVLVRSKHESLEASLAGYDLTEGGTNLEYALYEGEGWHIEFKECMPDQARDLGSEIAALSSQGGGGTIFLGVQDSGNVVGIEQVATLKQRDQWRHRISQIATKVVQPPNPVTVYFNERDGIDVIKIWVPEGAAPIYYVGHIAYIRNLDESRKATPEEIAEYVARRSSTGGRNGH